MSQECRDGGHKEGGKVIGVPAEDGVEEGGKPTLDEEEPGT